MTKAFFLLMITIAFLQSATRSQAPGIQWQKCLGGSDYEGANCIRQTADGGYIVAGSTISTDGDLLNAGVQGWQGDCLLMKLAPGGTVMWVKVFGGFSGEQVLDVWQTSDGGYIAAGITSSTGGDFPTGPGGWLMRLTADGSILWQVKAGNMGNAVRQTADGGFVVGGDNYITKFDGAGVWQWTYPAEYIIRSVGQTSDGGYIATGEAHTNRGNDFGVIKLNGSGELEREKYFGGFGDDDPASVLQTADGGYIVAGSTSSNNNGDVSGYHGGTDCWVVKLDHQMNIIWKNAFGGSGYEKAWCIQPAGSGYIVTGETGSEDGDVSGFKGGNRDVWVLHISEAGSLVWQKTLGGADWEISKGIQKTADGGYIVVGNTGSNDGDVSGLHNPGNFLPDIWVVKLLPDMVLPVTFGLIDASIKNDVLTVNWTAQTEINNAYYLVEASEDGRSFKAISGKIFTKATDGYSSVPLQYNFSKAFPVLQGMALLFLFSTVGYRKRSRLKVLCLAAFSLALLTLSCKKDTLEIPGRHNQKLYIRIVQVDKDGNKSPGKVIAVKNIG